MLVEIIRQATREEIISIEVPSGLTDAQARVKALDILNGPDCDEDWREGDFLDATDPEVLRVLSPPAITMTTEWTNDVNSPGFMDERWLAKANHWNCTISYKGRSMELQYHMMSAIKRAPNITEVLFNLAGEAVNCTNVTFEEWAEEYDYDSDSRKTEAMFDVIVERSKELETLLGDDYDQLIEVLADENACEKFFVRQMNNG